MKTKSNPRTARSRRSLHGVVGRRGPNRESLQWATQQLEQMAKEETDPKLKALWLRSAARGYELGAKPANAGTQRPGDAEATNATRATPPGSLE